MSQGTTLGLKRLFRISNAVIILEIKKCFTLLKAIQRGFEHEVLI